VGARFSRGQDVIGTTPWSQKRSLHFAYYTQLMGFRKPNLDTARQAIRTCLVEIHSPYNDGWTSSACKHDLYVLKSWLEDEYMKLPTFVGEEAWEQERIVEILRR
jgi:hypothetical protein